MPDLTPSELDEVADAFFAAMERRDLDAVRAIYADDARIWHARDAVDTDVRANLDLLTTFFARTSDIRYEVVRRFYRPDGLVQQHVVRGRTADGRELEIPVSFMCLVDDDRRIVRIEEYLNPQHSPLADVRQAPTGA